MKASTSTSEHKSSIRNPYEPTTNTSSMAANHQHSTSSQPLGSTNTVFIIDPWFDPSYVRTLPGMLKVAVILFNLIGFICIQVSDFWSNGRGVFFSIVAHLGLWFSAIMLGLYLFHVVEKYHKIKWLKIEMIAYVVLAFLNVITASIAVAFGSAAYSAAGFFSYLCMVIYGGDAYLKARALQAGEIAQGRRIVTKQQHITTPPAILS